ncbi:MAG: hypothetical protein IMZ62_10215 [Chloroflexi bacterium]|nr:hypothetical protein [Chloroflexota bacterium]
METTRDLATMVRELAEARMELFACSEEIGIQLGYFKEEHQILFGQEVDMKADVARLEAEIKAAALLEYEQTQDKHPAEGVNVKEITSYNYEVPAALVWAEVYAPVCILPPTLNERAFNELCKSDLTRPGFVVVETTPRVEIAKDLSKVLEVK